jgi:hypothetical protein
VFSSFPSFPPFRRYAPPVANELGAFVATPPTRGGDGDDGGGDGPAHSAPPPKKGLFGLR